ncbi:HIT family protein [Hypericibacter sp.]|uniref:HIT family protein n=1 Tax=Hypericibacter sp. TaxID=2705401 RepID=UPI003D6D6D4D
MTTDCLFCKIAAGTVPGHILHEDEAIVAFLDINPIRDGHAQIVPRVHHAYFDELPPELASRILHLGQRLAVVLKRLYGVRRVAFCFTGGDVPHAHAHLVPMHMPTDITSRRYIVEEKLTFRATPRVPDATLAETALRLRRELALT